MEDGETAGNVAYLGDIVSNLTQQQLVHGITRTVQLPDGSRTVEARAAITVWVRVYQDERDRLVRAAKAAIAAGVDERQIRLAEQQAQQLAAVIRAILTDLGHSLDDENVRKVVRFRLIEGAGDGSSARFIEPSAEASRAGDGDVADDAS